MTWLTWRQFRAQALVALVALAALAITLAVTETPSTPDTPGDGNLYSFGNALMYVLPAIIGAFWGAPLVARELETGTHRMVWNQSVTRTRWLATKLLGVGLTGMATAGLASLAVTWWSSPIDKDSMERMQPDTFAVRGIVPIGYTAFAFVLGVAAGMLLRRTVAAMAATIGVVTAAQIAMPFLARGHLIPPVRTTTPIDTSSGLSWGITDDNNIEVYNTGTKLPGAWILSDETVTATGQPLSLESAEAEACMQGESGGTCLVGLDLRQEVVYQPASRFWALQWLETTIFLTLTVLLAGFCFWWIRRRLN